VGGGAASISPSALPQCILIKPPVQGGFYAFFLDHLRYRFFIAWFGASPSADFTLSNKVIRIVSLVYQSL